MPPTLPRRHVPPALRLAITRRRLAGRIAGCVAGCIAAASLAGLPASAAAQDATPIRMIVPFGAGTTTDTIARIVAEAMARVMGQTVVVENRAGAGGAIGTELAAKAPANGRTLVMGTVGTHAINATLFRRLAYDPVADFAPIVFAGYTPTLLVVPPQGAGSLKDLAALAARPQGLTFASAGNGTSGHLAGELLAARLGGRMVHAPYKEGAQAVNDVIAGNVDFMFYHPAAVVPQLKAGRLRALGVSSRARTAAAPEVATLVEQGVADFDLTAWFMLYAPAATPPSTLAALREAAATALAGDDARRRLEAQGVELRSLNADELAAFVRDERIKWGELVKRSGAQVD